MKINQNATNMKVFTDPANGDRYGYVQNCYSIDISPKELRQIGYNLGYGVTKGAWQ